MKIARIIARLNVGGPAIQAVLLTQALREAGHETVLLTGEVQGDEANAEGRARLAGIELIKVPGLGRAVSPLDDLRALLAIRRELRRLNPDLVHTHTAKAGTLGRLAALSLGIPAVHTFHGHVFDGYFSPLKTRSVIVAERALTRCSRAIVAISERQRQDLVTRYRIAPACKVRMVKLGFELEPFASIYTARGPLPGAAVRAGWVGRHTAIKDPLLFPQIARRYRDAGSDPKATFVMHGAGEMRGAVDAEAARLGLDARYQHAGLHHDMPPVYRNLDVLILTSRNEGTPVAVIESMASGCLPIAADVGGVADLMGEAVEAAVGFTVCRHGVLVQERTPEVFCAALDFMRGNPQRWHATTSAAHAFAMANFSGTRLVTDLLELYRQVLCLPAPAALRQPNEVLP